MERNINNVVENKKAIIMYTFGRILKDLRLEKGLTQAQLAKELHLDKSTIAKYETDKMSPSCLILKNIAIYFQVSADYLLGLED